MQNWEEILETYKQYNSERFNNRSLELVKGILSIAKFIDQETHDKIESYLEQSFLDRDTEDLITNWDYNLLKTMYDHCTTQKEWCASSVVSVWLREILPDDNQPKHLPNWIGKKLSKIPLFKKRRVGAGVEYLINKELIKRYMESKGYPLDPTHTTPTTLELKGDKLKELESEFKDTCCLCNEIKPIKFTSIIAIGKNYCKECVVREKNNELLEKCYGTAGGGTK